MREWARRHWPPLLAFGLSLAAYLLTLCPTVYVEGSGELIGATGLLGTPHPTGYPLYCLFGRLVALLPWETPAWRVGLATALTSSLAVAALAAFLHCRGCHPWIALGASLAFGFSATFWSQAVIAEVYGMSMLAAVLVLDWGLRAVETRRAREWVFLGFLMGVGLTTHLSQLLLWPGLLLLLVHRVPQLWRSGKGAAWLVLGGVLGYSPILYLPLRSGRGPGFHWGFLDSPGLLWDHLTGALYRSSFFAVPLAAMGLNAQRWVEQILSEFHPLLVPVAGWGVWVGCRRDRPLAWVTGVAVLANLMVALNYQRDPNGMAVFFLVSILGSAIFLAQGLEQISQALSARLRSPRVPGLVGLLVPLLVLVGNHVRADRSVNRVAERYGRDILQGLPAGAVLLTEGDDASFVLDYLQRVEGERPDVTLYNRIGRGTDLVTPAEQHLSPVGRAKLRSQREAELIRDSGRPIFFLFPHGMPVEGYRFVPAGLCYRAWPEVGAGVPEAPRIELANARWSGGYRDPWVRKIQGNYWYMVGEQQQALGDTAAALAAYQEAAKTAWDSRSMRFNVAAAFLRRGRLDAAWEHAHAAALLDPYNPKVRELQSAIRRSQFSVQGAERLPKEAVVRPVTP